MTSVEAALRLDGVTRGLRQKVEFQLRFRSNFDPLFVEYAKVLDDPRREAERIAEFVDRGLDVDKMVAAVDARLYRNRRQGTVDPSS